MIGILGGTGSEGRGIALRFASSGCAVVIGSRQEAKAREAAVQILLRTGELPDSNRVRGASNGEAARCGFVFLAVPFENASEVLRDSLPHFRPGTVVIDATVPLVFDKGAVGIRPLPEGSGSRHLATLLPPGVHLAAAFKTIPAHLLERLESRLDCDILVCSDSEEARVLVIELIRRLGDPRPVDAGGLDSAAALEQMSALAIRLNRKHKVKTSRFRIIGL